MSSGSRVYPTCCTSAFCGAGSESCPTCPNLKAKQEFEAWVEQTQAVVADRIWSPLVYIPTREIQP